MADFCLVTPHVLVEIAFLREGQIAALTISKWANEWSLLCVNSQVIIEVVPLSKIQSTAWMVALQNFEVSMSFWVFKLEDSELAR